MTYAGHRTRRRLAPHQAPVRLPVDDDGAVDLDDAAPVPALPPEPEPAAPPAPTTAAEFVAALAVAMTGVPLADHTAAQLDRLRAVLAVAAPGITLTPAEPDPDPEETAVPTTVPPAELGPVDPSPPAEAPPPAEPSAADRAILAGLLAQLDVARAERIAAEDHLAQVLAQAAQEAAAPERAAAAITADQAATAAAHQRTTGVLAAHLVCLAQRALLAYGRPADVPAALALTAGVPHLAQRSLRAAPGQPLGVDEGAALHLLRGAAVRTPAPQ